MIAAHAPAPPAAVVSAAKPKTDRTLKADLVRLAKHAGGSGGFTVLDGGSGKVIAESAGSTARPLGSTAKLLTTAAAAALFRRTELIITPVVTAAPLDTATGTLGGDLFLVGYGDPLLGEAQLQGLADDVQTSGIRTITGSIVGDGGAFDALTGGPATGGAFDLNFNGSIGALTYDRGRQAVGGPLQPDPARGAAYRFDDVLEARGITIKSVPHEGTAPVGARGVGQTPDSVAAIIKDINKVSDDFAAEVLAKDLVMPAGGPRPATTAAAAVIIKAQAKRLGATLSPVDGSGVDPATRGSTRQMARLVRRVRARSIIATSLPIAGVDGTLATRMTSGAAHRNCHAKTGSLPQSRDSSLAGWCRVHGRTLVFSLQRVHVTSQAAAKAAEDAMVQRIAASRPC